MMTMTVDDVVSLVVYVGILGTMIWIKATR